MLFLTRSRGDTISIGQGVTILVREVRHDGTVVLGIDAPGQKVLRGEAKGPASMKYSNDKVIDKE